MKPCRCALPWLAAGLVLAASAFLFRRWLDSGQAVERMRRAGG